MSADVDAGSENIGRLKSKLRRTPEAMTALIRMGLNGASIDRLHLGLREPYRSRVSDLEVRDAVCFPLLGEGMRPLGRYAYLNLEGVTRNPQRSTTWGPGAPQVYRLGSFAPDAVAVVAADVVDCWLAWQASRGSAPEVAFISRSHAEGWPGEWREPAFWARFARIVLLPGAGAEDFDIDVAHRIGRPSERASEPAGFADIRELAASGSGSETAFGAMLEGATASVRSVPVQAAAIAAEAVGRFEATPLEITGAFRGGFCFYPFAVERRSYEDRGRGEGGGLVQSYETLVLRSDGHLLSTERLPAPRGTPAQQRVLALSDGTRIVGEPTVSAGGTWSFASIERFIEWRMQDGVPPFRPLGDLLAEVERYLRSRVWLPVDEHHLLAACYVVLSHCYRVFDAIPVLLITGGRGTGKSELGESMASVAFHATVASQLRAAGMIRLLDETRGLVVLDDMDGTSANAVSGWGDLVQAVKSGYKQATARKPISDRGGNIRMVDFFSPKVITNTRSVDPIVGSRVLTVRTAAPVGSVPEWDEPWSQEMIFALRDELHCWGMAAAAELHAVYRALGAVHADRRLEIEAPLRAIVQLTRDDAIARRLEAALAHPLTDPAATFG